MNTNAPTGLDLVPGINLLPESWRGPVLIIAVLSPYITRAAYSVMNGGGLKGIFTSIWLGTNTPKQEGE